MVDYGDAPVIPSDPVTSHAAIERVVREVVDAGAIPIVLGGDHSIAEPDIRACAAKHGPVGLVHFDTHTDTGREVYGVEISHGTPMFRLVEAGAGRSRALRPDRPAGLLAGRGGVPLAGGAGHHELLHARRPRARDRGGRRPGARDRGGRAGVPVRRRRRARPGVRAGHGDARARRDDERRPSLGVPHGRRRGRARRRGRGRGLPLGRRARWTSRRSSPSASCARS